MDLLNLRSDIGIHVLKTMNSEVIDGWILFVPESKNNRNYCKKKPTLKPCFFQDNMNINYTFLSS